MELLYGRNISRQGVNNRGGNGALNRVAIQEGRCAENQQKILAGLKRILADLKISGGVPQRETRELCLKKSDLT